ncbi:glycosyltransferase family 4 protein [Novosphingobium sp. KA1]|uniref:glycosyltransferase family 4 protein n=1 Tax=Novosphingobium sp. (strain KA1) TaxID=164608 RepID=UPI001A8F2029|nr:glycosyltransferase family 4 protein [Novosphingobium sp. KA1]
MRLLFLTRSLPFHHVGGMEAVAWDLARSLAERGHDVEILTTQTAALPERCKRDGVRIRTMDIRSGRYSAAYWRQTAHLFETEYRNSVDLVLSIGMGAYAIAFTRRHRDSPPVLMQSHGQAWGELISKLSVPSPVSWLKAPKNLLDLARDRALRHFDEIIAVGPAVEDVLRAPPTRWLLGDTPVTVVANGIDERRFTFDAAARTAVRTELDIDLNAPAVVSACRLHVQKGLAESLSGFARARQTRPNLVYIIAGAGPAEARLREHAAQLGIARAVHFVGPVDRQTLPRMLSAGDVFLFTSKRREGLALGPLEAAATGLPCILSRHLAIAELDTWLVDPDDANGVAQAILSSLPPFGTADRGSRLPFRYSLAHATTCYEDCFRRAIDVAGNWTSRKTRGV